MSHVFYNSAWKVIVTCTLPIVGAPVALAVIALKVTVVKAVFCIKENVLAVLFVKGTVNILPPLGACVCALTILPNGCVIDILLPATEADQPAIHVDPLYSVVPSYDVADIIGVVASTEPVVSKITIL